MRTLEELEEQQRYLDEVSRGGDFTFRRDSIAFKCHECTKCETVIGKNEQFVRIVGTSDGIFYMNKYHETCYVEGM